MKIQDAESFEDWLDWLAKRKIDDGRESKGQYFINLVSESGLDFSKSSEDFVGVDLSGIDLSKASLAGANFRKSDLKRSTLVCTDLSNADLRGVELQDADLSYANLSGADLSGADLSGANLQGAILNNSNLTDTDPTNVYLRYSQFENVTCSEGWHQTWQRDNTVPTVVAPVQPVVAPVVFHDTPSLNTGTQRDSGTTSEPGKLDGQTQPSGLDGQTQDNRQRDKG